MKTVQYSLAVLTAITVAVVARGVASEARSSFKEVVNVMDYGAVCDGAADDATVLQNAINALPAAGGTVYIPPSRSGARCTFSKPLTLPDGAKILGAGKWATVLRYTGS